MSENQTVVLVHCMADNMPLTPTTQFRKSGVSPNWELCDTIQCLNNTRVVFHCDLRPTKEASEQLLEAYNIIVDKEGRIVKC